MPAAAGRRPSPFRVAVASPVRPWRDSFRGRAMTAACRCCLASPVVLPLGLGGEFHVLYLGVRASRFLLGFLGLRIRRVVVRRSLLAPVTC